MDGPRTLGHIWPSTFPTAICQVPPFPTCLIGRQEERTPGFERYADLVPDTSDERRVYRLVLVCE